MPNDSQFAVLQSQVTQQAKDLDSLRSKADSAATKLAQMEGASNAGKTIIPIVVPAGIAILGAIIGVVFWGNLQKVTELATENKNLNVAQAGRLDAVESFQKGRGPADLIEMQQQVKSLQALMDETRKVVDANRNEGVTQRLDFIESNLASLKSSTSATASDFATKHTEKMTLIAQLQSESTQALLRIKSIDEYLKERAVVINANVSGIAALDARLGAAIAEIEAQNRGDVAFQNAIRAWMQHIIQIQGNGKIPPFPAVDSNEDIPAAANVDLNASK